MTTFHKITGHLYCCEGVRIGGLKEIGGIGGVDNPIIRHPISKLPYIPGSSLKGKMRSLVEEHYKTREREIERLRKKLESVNDREREKLEKEIKEKEKLESPCGCADSECEVCTLFGPHMKPDHNLGPTRLLFRDAAVTEELDENSEIKKLELTYYFKKDLEKLWEEENLRYVEEKPENIINRKTHTAKDFRQMERIPAGTVFDIEIILIEKESDKDKKEKWIEIIKTGLGLLEDTGIGGCISRGYGKIKFYDMKIDGEDFLKNENLPNQTKR